VVVTKLPSPTVFPDLVAALRPGGVLVYETFARGNERYGRPSNPDFLLEPGELLRRVEPLSVVGFEKGWFPRRSRRLSSASAPCGTAAGRPERR